VIEFTPNETGSIPFSCSMGMYRGVITVVDEQTNTPLSNKMLADLEK
jgi:plastocyanin domain-containing protein